MTTTTRDLPTYVYPTRTGGLYFRRKGHTGKIRLAHRPGQPGFDAEYHGLMAGVANDTLALPVVRAKGHINERRDSVGALAVAYLQDHKFANMDQRSQTDRRRYLETCLKTVPAGHDEQFAHWAPDDVTQTHVMSLRDALPGPKRRLRADQSDGVWRDAHMRAMRTMFNWGIKRGKVRFNPFALLDPLVGDDVNTITWVDSDLAKYEKRHASNPTALLALTLLKYFVVRRSDVVKLGAPMLDGEGVLRFVETKNSTSKVRRKIKMRAIKLRPEVRAALDACPGAWNGETFLKSPRRGGAYTVDGFGHQFRQWCKQAGIAGRAHGVRRFVATRAAERGAGDWQVAALLGHSGTKNVKPYTAKVRQSQMFETTLDSVF